MNNPENENGKTKSDFTWRLGQSKDRGVGTLDSVIALELADTQGLTLASFYIPSATINELLRPYLSIFLELQLDGSMSVDSEFLAIIPSPTKTDLLELVMQALALEMLEDEPEAANMLSVFRTRLLKSLEHVDEAIASLPKP